MSSSQYPFNLLNGFHLKFDENQRYDIFEVDAINLLNCNRFDLYAILTYIDHKVKKLDLTFALDLYKKRTEAMTGFKFAEAGNIDKNTFEKFTESLNVLIEIFKSDNYDPNISLIPIDKNNVLIDGAHRTACAAYFNRRITVIKFIDWDFNLNIDSVLLRDKFLMPNYLDTMALEYCKWHKNIYMIVLWPKAFKNSLKKNEAHKLIAKSCNVVYKKDIKLEYTAIRNLILQIYNHMDWIGTIDDKFCNTFAKAKEVFESNQKTEFILVEADSFEVVFNLKQEIRKVFEVDLASIHSTDNWEQTFQISNLIYNQNSIHHLQLSEPDKYKASYKLIEEYKNIINTIGHNPENYILDASIVMSIYGIREANDLDYLTWNADGDKVASLAKVPYSIDNHHDWLKFHSCNLEDLLFNPSNYFVFNDLKFISLECLSKFKENKKEKKDLVDVKLIDMYRNNNSLRLSYFLLKLKNDYKRKKLIYRELIIINLMSFLKRIGLYKSLRKFYHFVKGF